MNLRALGSKVIVLEDKPRTTHNNGMLIPVAYQRPASVGWVESVGREAARRVPGLRSGIRIAYRPYAGTTVVWQGRRYRWLEWWSDLDGIVGSVDPDEFGE